MMTGAGIAALLLMFVAAGMRSASAAKRQKDQQRAIPLVQDCLGKLGLIDRNVTINVETMRVPMAEKPNRTLWAAECEDSFGRYRAYILVDSQSGEIVSATCAPSLTAESGVRPLNRSEAIAEAARLARRCTPVSANEKLRLNGEPERSGDMWYVALKSGKRSVRVSIRASTGAVIALTNRGPVQDQA
jgi:hypothetical protein